MRNTQEELRLLTLEAVAEILQVSKRILFRMIQQKQVPALRSVVSGALSNCASERGVPL